jgi:glycosyltransferase involved in cell wall biosynthesis
MRVLVDFTQIPTERTGVGVYAENLVRELSLQQSVHDVLVLLLQQDEVTVRDFTRGCSNIRTCILPSKAFRNRALLLLFEQLILPFLLLRYKIDVVHSLHYTHPLISPCPRVVTIHDLTFLRFPELHTRGRRLVMPFFIRRAMAHAEVLIFVSDATRRDAESLIPARHGLREVVPLGVDPKDFMLTPEDTGDVLARLSISKPFLLFLGTIEPRKNIGRLIAAFESVANDFPELLLVLAGKPGWEFEGVLEMVGTSNFRDRIRLLGFISDFEKRHLLVRCSVLVYPSLYEGFGLPVLEGMAAGAPVITSNVSSLPEVAGNVAMLVNPLSAEDIAEAVRRILDDPEAALMMGVLGRQRAREFDWEKMAARTYDLYGRATQAGAIRSTQQT